MNIHGLGHTTSINTLLGPKKNAAQDTQEVASTSTTSEAATAEISPEAKALSQKSGKANPHQVAETLGARNFGQALKALREAGIDLNGGFVSDLVHGDEAALAAAQEALTPPVAEELSSSAELPLSEGDTSEPELQTSENSSLVIDASATSLTTTPEVTTPTTTDDSSLLEILLDKTPEAAPEPS